MKNKLVQLLSKNKVSFDKNGICIAKSKLTNDTLTSQSTWENIYNFDLKKLLRDRKDFNESKLKDHTSYIVKHYNFTPQTVYLEIGCGPCYIAEYLMANYNCYFIGIDFNYKILLSVKKYFDSKGFKKYILIHGDLKNIPIRKNSIDFIYGGGVIEHFRDTTHILKELFNVLKPGGVAFNTVPAFNFFWPVSIKKNIPSFPIAKQLFELIHIKLLNYRLLNKYHGYELSFGINQLKRMHAKVGFKNSVAGAFAFHPSFKKMPNKHLRNFYYALSKISLISPIIYIASKK
jgi:ubiquinone/menaquinone biosynthesis C-methylase UbiE